ncbi:MAG: DUF2914 domain-containing protein [Candidatus Paceibacterota bacterium]|jgi:hypothetical protein
MFFTEPIRNFYSRFERPISSLSLILGFIFDVFTLKRVDAFWENAWIFGYLVIIGIFITLIHIKENEIGGERNPGKAHFWYVNILQFSFGGVFSAFLILYFRSADIMVAWPFIALLAAIFIANEFFKKHYIRLSFQISFFFLSIYWFAIFLVPVLLHKINAWIFLLSGLISLVAISFYVTVLFYFTKGKFIKSKELIVLLISSIFILVNVLYFTNLIPPIPLSLKDGGIYHSVQKNKEGNYKVTYEDYGWMGYFKLYPDFKKKNGEPVYVFSAIFSPKNLNTVIVHEWQHYDEMESRWTTESMIKLPVIGGRDGGFRTYSMRTNVALGKWRVNVKTESGQIIGRQRFNIVLVDTDPTLTTAVK